METIESIRNDILHTIESVFPTVGVLGEDVYDLNSVLDQIVFELIKENYKKTAPRTSLQSHLEQYFSVFYPKQQTNRPYSRATQSIQHYYEIGMDEIEKEMGLRIPGMEKTARNSFELNEVEAWQIILHNECKLFDAVLQHKVDSSHKISETKFVELMSDYSDRINDFAYVDDESIVTNTFLVFAYEESMFIDFLYYLTLAAEGQGYPTDIPAKRIFDVISLRDCVPSLGWTRDFFAVSNSMIMKRHLLCPSIYMDSDEEWFFKEAIIEETIRMKSYFLYPGLNEPWIRRINECTEDDQATFIRKSYWIWNIRPKYDWNTDRIKYYRKLNSIIRLPYSKKIRK